LQEQDIEPAVRYFVGRIKNVYQLRRKYNSTFGEKNRVEIRECEALRRRPRDPEKEKGKVLSQIMRLSAGFPETGNRPPA
jgi:hypothetical protein